MRSAARKKAVRRLGWLILVAAMMLLIEGSAHAEAGRVQHVTSLEAFIDATDAADEVYDQGTEVSKLTPFSTRRIRVKREISSLEGAVKGVSYDGATLLCFASAEDTREAYEKLSAKYGEENVLPDLPLFSAEAQGWGVEFMNLDDQIRRATKAHAGSNKKVTVAVIDSGINRNHSIFRGTQISSDSKSMIEAGGTIADDNGHGTAVSGIIAESTPDNVELMAIKVFGKSTDSTTEDINQAIAYASEKGADVINLSLSSNQHEIIDLYEQDYPNLIPNFLRELDLQLKMAANKGAIICAASGNDGGDLDALYSFPAFSQFTLAVGSIDRYGDRSAFSNYGMSLDFCAPGKDVSMAAEDSNTGYYVSSGTSFATPYISACCAYVKMDDPTANLISARETLKEMSVDYGAEGWDKYYGWGMPKYEDFIDDGEQGGGTDPSKDDGEGSNANKTSKAVMTVTVNTKTVTANVVKRAIKDAGSTDRTAVEIVLGKKVRKISKGAFKGTSVRTLVVKSRKLSRRSVRGSLKGSRIKTVKIKAGGKKINKKYVKKYRKIFTKKNAGRKVRIK